MLYKVKLLHNYKLGASDGEIGKVKDFYFDDKYWTIRYLIADTGNWLKDRQVLISPYALINVNTDEKIINTRLSKKQIEQSPHLDVDKPVSSQFEEVYHKYYKWVGYWYGPNVWGPHHSPPRDKDQWALKAIPIDKKWDPNLRSTHEVTGYPIHAKDGDIGHIDDFVIDDETWMIRYLIIDTRNLLHGKKVLISPQWIKRVSWTAHEVFTNHTSKKIKQSPEYNDDMDISREYEESLCDHYDCKGYWTNMPLTGL